MTYSLCKKLIAKGNFEVSDMMDKLDVFLLNNRITDEEYKELVGMLNDVQSEE